jgi:hypothetical protein
MEIVKSLLAARYEGGLKSMELMASPPYVRATGCQYCFAYNLTLAQLLTNLYICLLKHAQA